ncbi:MAG: hypothetical protein K8I30_18200, partial [Anaerolineae bacterium]|nr:hypothetical protein [Anaerolineae bacterium]
EYINPVKGIQAISSANGLLVLEEQYPLINIGDRRYFYRVDGLQFPVTFPYDEILVVRGTVYQRLDREEFEPDFTRWESYAGVFVDPFTPYPDETAVHVRFEDGQVWIDDVLQEALSNSQFVSSDGLYEFLDKNMLQIHMATRYVRSIKG